MKSETSADSARVFAGDCPHRSFELDGVGVAKDYARSLLGDLGGRVRGQASGDRDLDPALEWARCGAMVLTGRGDEPPRLAPGPLASCARGTVEALAHLAPAKLAGRLEAIDGPALLGERAAIYELERQGSTAPGGSCRLLQARDGWLALNLARPDDWELLPAWLGEASADRGFSNSWAAVAAGVEDRGVAELAERARLLGLPMSPADPPPGLSPGWLRVAARGSSVGRDPATSPLVVDLSSLWAGPLCTQLLGTAGARVIKVESSTRPDGVREGRAPFADLMNAGKECVALDFRADPDRLLLAELVRCADVVVESARPRALAQLGISAEAMVKECPGLTWLSITGYGRREPMAGWVAFGDDASVAAGLAWATRDEDAMPLFCGDAIADPLTGLHAAVAAQASWRAGGGHLLDLSLRDVAAHCLLFAADEPAAVASVEDRGAGVRVRVGEEIAEVIGPRARAREGAMRPLGADSERVLRELVGRC